MLEVVKFTDILFHNPKNLEECKYYFENFNDDVIERRKQISYYYFSTLSLTENEFDRVYDMITYLEPRYTIPSNIRTISDIIKDY